MRPHTVGPVLLQPETHHNGRVSEAELGLGDHVHIEFLCLPDEEAQVAACSGTLEFILLLRQAECRADTDCGSNEICDSQMGFCRAEVESDEGCTTVPNPRPRRTALFGLICMLSVMTFRRFTKRRNDYK